MLLLIMIHVTVAYLRPTWLVYVVMFTASKLIGTLAQMHFIQMCANKEKLTQISSFFIGSFVYFFICLQSVLGENILI